jgi:hypothetical protein
MDINAKIEKEKAKLEAAGSFEEYLKTRRTQIDLIWFLVTIVAAFVAGAIIF